MEQKKGCSRLEIENAGNLSQPSLSERKLLQEGPTDDLTGLCKRGKAKDVSERLEGQ